MGNSQSSSHGGSRHSAASGSSAGPVSGLRSRASTLTGAATSASARSQQQRQQHDEPRVVDGGWTDPQSLLYARLEYHRPTVHRLVADRKLAPFYLGLQDFEDDWAADRIVDALAEAEEQATQNLRDAHAAAIEAAAEAEAAQLSAPTGTRKHKEAVAAYTAAVVHRERLAETLKAREKRGGGGLQLTNKLDTAGLYQGNALECPICFLYYPHNMVHTRCCDQPICTECFVQIKRADPTPTHLESEPAACPFCMEPNFGCVYEKPVRPPYHATPSSASGSSETGVARPAATTKPRRKSFAHTEKEVVTTDMIHPDWEAKLEAMKATAARRANRRIVFRQVGDRLIPVGISSGRGSGDGANPTMATTTLPPNFLSQIAAALDAANEGSGSGRRRGSRSSRHSRGNEDVVALLESLGLGGGPDLEEMMVQEAMRLSQLEEEDRQKKTQEEEATEAQAAGSTQGTAATQETESPVPQTPRTTERLLSEAMVDESAPTDTPPPAPAAALRSTAPTPTSAAVASSPPAPFLDVDIPSTPIEFSTPPIAVAGPSHATANGELGAPLDTPTSRASDTTSSIVPPPTPSPSQGYQLLGDESDQDASGDTATTKHAPREHVENGGVGRLVDV
ncbi:hypothetical protein JCM3770_006050 [Rhodotorula araucariae]